MTGQELHYSPGLSESCADLLPVMNCGRGQTQIPGAAVGCVFADGRAGAAADGFAELRPSERNVSVDTWFDLASLTKVIFTTRLVLELCAAGRLHLDDTLSSHIPDLRQYDVDSAPERALTIEQCLTHQTFLPRVATALHPW